MGKALGFSLGDLESCTEAELDSYLEISLRILGVKEQEGAEGLPPPPDGSAVELPASVREFLKKRGLIQQ